MSQQFLCLSTLVVFIYFSEKTAGPQHHRPATLESGDKVRAEAPDLPGIRLLLQVLCQPQYCGCSGSTVSVSSKAQAVLECGFPMGCILTCCMDSICGCCSGEEEPCYESDTYEAVAAATSESTTVEPGKLDVGATEGHDLQHISNQKMPTGKKAMGVVYSLAHLWPPFPYPHPQTHPQLPAPSCP